MQLKRVVIYEHNFIYPVFTSCEYCPACSAPPLRDLAGTVPMPTSCQNLTARKSPDEKKPAFAGSRC